ncbi:hypothetical protein [Hymenobacter cellulosivorans]|uniref:Uncharacterized protein n=1 Tax=Hymenobacter cellulosivorans TaxID=2932249 RepID=A0ABY4F5R2_9BACT|nr:hypothetical protein [Hymenobacter cellulosivorans]UOQ51915.1 hypothetical protein MUN80_19385 [Hymenobacter cellulosivorans]
MEKLKVLLLILGGLVVFVWRMVQKMRETARREQQERPSVRRAPLPGSSFDELLKQMQQQNQRGNPSVPAPTTPAGRRLPQEAAAPKARTLEQPARKAQSQERRATNTSLEKTVAPARRNTGMDHPAADNPLRRPRPTAPAPVARRVITDRLRTPTDLREAFILSEILKRKFE